MFEKGLYYHKIGLKHLFQINEIRILNLMGIDQSFKSGLSKMTICSIEKNITTFSFHNLKHSENLAFSKKVIFEK